MFIVKNNINNLYKKATCVFFVSVAISIIIILFVILVLITFLLNELFIYQTFVAIISFMY